MLLSLSAKRLSSSFDACDAHVLAVVNCESSLILAPNQKVNGVRGSKQESDLGNDGDTSRGPIEHLYEDV